MTLAERLAAKYCSQMYSCSANRIVSPHETNHLVSAVPRSYDGHYQRVLAAINEALETAAKMLDDEVLEHRRRWAEIETEHRFCEEYGCTSIERFAARIRALKSVT